MNIKIINIDKVVKKINKFFEIFLILGKKKSKIYNGVYYFFRKKIFYFGNVLFLEFVFLDNLCFVIYINIGLSIFDSYIYLNLYILKY